MNFPIASCFITFLAITLVMVASYLQMGFIENNNGSYIIQPVVEGGGPDSPHIVYKLNDQVKYDGM